MIPFNKPYYPALGEKMILEALESGKISGDGFYNKKVTDFFKTKFKFKYSLTTTSCTDSLELIALTAGIKEGDEVIIPNYTFVSTANAFLLRGAKIIFADSNVNSPCIDLNKVMNLVTERTKALVIVHYGGSGFELFKLNSIKIKFPNLIIIEDAAQCINSFYSGIPLGLFGDYAAFSFHETKNISCGEGGLFVCKDPNNFMKAQIIREKGTNRSAFFRKEVDKYGWKKLGSSFLPSDLLMAVLYSQLIDIDKINSRRIKLWNYYFNNLKVLEGRVSLPKIEKKSQHNGHIFYIILDSEIRRNDLINYLRINKVQATFHYSSLNESEFYKEKYERGKTILKNSRKYSQCLLRLPLYHKLNFEDIDLITGHIIDFFSINKH